MESRTTVVRWLEMTPAGGWTTIIPAGIEDSAGLCRLLPAATASGQGGSWPILVFVDEVYRTHVVGWPEVAPVGRKKLQNPLLHSVFFFFLFSGDDLLGQFPATEGLYGGDAWLWSVERCLDFTPVVSVRPEVSGVRHKVAGKSAPFPRCCCLLVRPGFRGGFPAVGRLRQVGTRAWLEDGCKGFVLVVFARPWTTGVRRKNCLKSCLQPAKQTDVFFFVAGEDGRRPWPAGTGRGRCGEDGGPSGTSPTRMDGFGRRSSPSFLSPGGSSSSLPAATLAAPALGSSSSTFQKITRGWGLYL